MSTPPPAKLVKLKGQWKGKSAGGCLNSPSTCRFNPQLFLTVEKPSSVNIALAQEDNFNIGFYVATADSITRRQLRFNKENIVAKTQFLAKECVELDIELQPGQYVVVPCTFYPANEGKFYISFASAGSIKISPLPPTGEWRCVTAKGEWKGKTAGGCKNHATYLNNPQFLMLTKKATKATITVSHAEAEFDAFGFYVTKTKASSHKMIKLRSEAILQKSQFIKSTESILVMSLEAKSRYAIIPTTFAPGNEAQFTLTIFSEHDVRLRQLKDPTELSMEGEWSEGDAGGSLAYPTWRNNPQFFLIVEKKASVRITLELLGIETTSAGFYLAPTCGGNNSLIVLRPQDILCQSGFANTTQISADTTLEASEHPYVIIPCTETPDFVTKFRLAVAILPDADCLRDSKVTRATKVMQLLPCNLQWRKKMFHGQWKEGFNGGAKDSPGWITSNPQFILAVSVPCRIVIILNQLEIGKSVGLYLIRSSEKGWRTQVNDDEIVAESEFLTGPETLLELTLEPGIYTIVPCCKERGISTPFKLFVHSGIDEMELLPVGEDQSFIIIKKGRASAATSDVHWEDLVIREKIGQGGFGVVYKGEWKGRNVAVKKVYSDEMEDRELESFRMETEIMRNLSHPNIMGCLAASLDSPNVFIVTELMGKGSMSDVLKNEPTLVWPIKLQMAIHAAEGMKYLHSRVPPIVHRDLKSLNLLVADDYTVKVADFGLSKATSGKSLNSKVGSLNWCAPEILLKRAAYTPQSDVYSFGMVLYELVTHHPPFQGMNPLQVVRAIDSGDLPKLPKETDEDMAGVVCDCWKTEPDDRPDFDNIIERLTTLRQKYL